MLYDIKIFILPNDNYQKIPFPSIKSKNVFYNFKNNIKKMYLNFIFVMLNLVFLIVVHLEKSNMIHFFFNICKIV
jgi:hypothetical protein